MSNFALAEPPAAPATISREYAKPIGPKRPRGGNRGGRKPGKPNPPGMNKRIYPAADLADAVVEKVLTGAALPKTHPTLGPISNKDRTMLSHIAAEGVEVFNERFSTQLRSIADLAAQRIREKLEADEFKTSELGFILSVAHDKRISIDGSRALQNASINVQVNNFGPDAKEAMLRELDGLINVTPPKPTPPST